ncbi:Na+/H+ antiporter NhaA [Luteococcus sp. Sow4_B9]|uniref:Na+/H+ antiporter NhaA n=1 Tax=Luteococcus sp. Sow4_B9 TaxID=3438792 RepID=UPI003F9AC38D
MTSQHDNTSGTTPGEPSTPQDTGARRHPRRRIAFGPGREANQLHLGEILRRETVGGILMLVATAAALLVANLAPSFYEHLSHLQLGPLSLHQWAADGLLTIFFFVAGLELKREIVEGSLSRPADALLPIMAALGGMAVPALIYVGVNAFGDGNLHGWGIPMATDIAFALAVLAIVGSQLPLGVRAFLLTLAIVDDLGAIIVIAVFFSSGISLLKLLGALVCVALFALAQRRRIDTVWLYIVLGIAAWWLMLQSGVHATIAGVALGLVTRTDEFEEHDPVDRWKHAIEPWSAGLVVPVFAFFAAGVPVNGEMMRSLVSNPVPLGVLLGLFVGKFVGVYSAARLTARFTSAELAPGVQWGDIAGTAVLCGIGFTVSLLISDLAFPGDLESAQSAKAAVLMASLLSALVGGFLLRRRSNAHDAVSQ